MHKCVRLLNGGGLELFSSFEVFGCVGTFLTFEKYVHVNLLSEEFLNSEYIRLASFVINEIWRIKQERCATTIISSVRPCD